MATTAGRAKNYTYDANGNMLSKLGEVLSPVGGSPSIGFGGGYELYEYNELGQLVRVSVDGGEATYTYNPNGLRHSKEVDTDKRVHA